MGYTKCTKCGLINPDSVTKCKCGYNFQSIKNQSQENDNKVYLEVNSNNETVQNVQNILMGYKNKLKDEYIFFGDDIPQKKLNNALGTYAPLKPEEMPLVLLDNTAGGSAKEGAILTAEHLYVKNLTGGPQSIAWKDITSVAFIDGFINNWLMVNDKKFLQINQPSNSSMQIFVGMIKDILSLKCPSAPQVVSSDVIKEEAISPDVSMQKEPSQAIDTEEKVPNNKLKEDQNQQSNNEVYWEIKGYNEILRYREAKEFISLYKIKRDIINGVITASTKARKIDPSQIKKESDKPEWKTVSEEFSDSFYIRVLFEPVWAHAIRGAKICARIGIIIWLIHAFSILDNNPINFWLLVFMFIWAKKFLPKHIREKLISSSLKAIKFILIGIAAWYTTPFIISLTNPNPVPNFFKKSNDSMFKITFSGFSFKEFIKIATITFFPALLVNAGAMIVGGFICLWPGMLIGTLVGFIRKNKLEKAPQALPEGWNIVKKGIILPVIMFPLLLLLYFNYVDYYITTFLPKQ